MRKPESELRAFVRALLSGESARRDGGVYVTPSGHSMARVAVAQLASAGIVAVEGQGCNANDATRNWLRRRMLDGDHFAGQHRELIAHGETTLNLAESPLSRLAAAVPGAAPFLERHHVEAGERVRQLADRAGLQPRLTMTYSAERTIGTNRNTARELSDFATDARKALAEIHAVLPHDCAAVVLDVCGLLKGLQQVEAERGWPRRSAKLVLRIGLDRLAEHFGYAPGAIGPENTRPRRWLGEGARPEIFE
ncbi:MAG: DUF6456 domain-containing protein [Devosia sp.]